jgi:phage anti-repressor protein
MQVFPVRGGEPDSSQITRIRVGFRYMYEEIYGVDFIGFDNFIKAESVHKTFKEYTLTIDMPKEQLTVKRKEKRVSHRSSRLTSSRLIQCRRNFLA